MVGFFIKYTFVRTVEILVVASLCPLQTSSHYLPVVTQAAVAPVVQALPVAAALPLHPPVVHKSKYSSD